VKERTLEDEGANCKTKFGGGTLGGWLTVGKEARSGTDKLDTEEPLNLVPVEVDLQEESVRRDSDL